MWIDPLKEPAAAAVRRMVSVVDCPAPSDVLPSGETNEKPAGSEVGFESVSVPVPVLRIVIVRSTAVPVVVEPKLTDPPSATAEPLTSTLISGVGVVGATLPPLPPLIEPLSVY